MNKTNSIPTGNLPVKHFAIPWSWLAVMALLLAVLAVPVVQEIKQSTASVPVALPAPSLSLAYDATGVMLNSVVYPTFPDRLSNPAAAFYDATAAMQNAIVLPSQVRPALQGLAYDATAAMRSAVVYSNEVRPASPGLPYDATGAMLEAVVFPTYPK